MSEVTCPRCATRQSIGAHAQGYTCTSCDIAWMFATCGSCGDRFHMHPGTRGWTCPTCGAVHGTVEATAPRASPQPAHGASDQDGRFADEQVDEAGRRSGRSQPPIAALMAVAGIVLVVGVAFLLTRGGGGDGGTPTPTVDPVAALCLDLRNLQTPRVDALTRVLQSLPAHADAIAATGDAALAANVRALAPAVEAYRDALATQSDDSQALRGMEGALAQLPC